MLQHREQLGLALEVLPGGLVGDFQGLHRQHRQSDIFIVSIWPSIFFDLQMYFYFLWLYIVANVAFLASYLAG